MSQKSNELKAQGIDVINLSVGEPDFNTPDHIKEAAKQAIDDNFSFYTPVPGYMSLRKAIAAKLKNENGLDYTPEQIVVSGGAKQSLCNVILSVINPGDEVIVEDPTYLVALQSFHVFDPVVLPVTMNPDGIDCDELAETIRNHPDAKFAYLIPNFQNPTGLSYSQEVHDKVVEIFQNSNVLLLEDNPYRELRMPGVTILEKVPSMQHCSPSSLPKLSVAVPAKRSSR